jgi:hypothetical protein
VRPALPNGPQVGALHGRLYQRGTGGPREPRIFPHSTVLRRQRTLIRKLYFPYQLPRTPNPSGYERATLFEKRSLRPIHKCPLLAAARLVVLERLDHSARRPMISNLSSAKATDAIQAVILTIGPAIFDLEVLAFNIAQFAKATVESRDDLS